MNHSDLTALAVRWLRRPPSRSGPNCHIALSEVGGVHSGERADAWGYRYGPGAGGPGSTLVEVKVSRSDFLADGNKPHRNGERAGIGQYRYYLCPVDLIQPDELPVGWGLVYASGKGRLKVVQGHTLSPAWGADYTPWVHPVDDELEKEILAHLLARLGPDIEALNAQSRQHIKQAHRLQEVEMELRRAKRELARLRRWAGDSSAR